MAKRERWNPLKSGYIDSKKVNRCSFAAETLFIRLIAASDDNSNFDGDAHLLACKLYAEKIKSGSITFEQVKQMRDELVTNMLIIPYEIEGEKYIHIPNNKKFLRNDIKPDIRFPDIPQDIVNKWFTESVTGLLRLRDENGSSDTDTDTDTDTTTKTDRGTALKEIFESARKIYPGTKLGLDTEYKNFQKKHKDWKETLCLLKPAIEGQIENRQHLKAANKFVPEWKHFKTWINNRCWEEILEPISYEFLTDGKICVVCHSAGFKFQENREGKKVYLCEECYSVIHGTTWGPLPIDTIRRVINSKKMGVA